MSKSPIGELSEFRLHPLNPLRAINVYIYPDYSQPDLLSAPYVLESVTHPLQSITKQPNPYTTKPLCPSLSQTG